MTSTPLFYSDNAFATSEKRTTSTPLPYSDNASATSEKRTTSTPLPYSDNAFATSEKRTASLQGTTDKSITCLLTLLHATFYMNAHLPTTWSAGVAR